MAWLDAGSASHGSRCRRRTGLFAQLRQPRAVSFRLPSAGRVLFEGRPSVRGGASATEPPLNSNGVPHRQFRKLREDSGKVHAGQTCKTCAPRAGLASKVATSPLRPAGWTETSTRVIAADSGLRGFGAAHCEHVIWILRISPSAVVRLVSTSPKKKLPSSLQFSAFTVPGHTALPSLSGASGSLK